MKTKSAPMMGRYRFTPSSPNRLRDEVAQERDQHLQKVLGPPGRYRSKRRAASGKRIATRRVRRRAMIAGSGIQASRPSGKKNFAIAGESFSTGGWPRSRINRALIGP
jgi:hypothetical protein